MEAVIMKKNRQRSKSGTETTENILSNNCTCTNQIYYDDLANRDDLFTKTVVTLTIKSQ